MIFVPIVQPPLGDSLSWVNRYGGWLAVGRPNISVLLLTRLPPFCRRHLLLSHDHHSTGQSPLDDHDDQAVKFFRISSSPCTFTFSRVCPPKYFWHFSHGGTKTSVHGILCLVEWNCNWMNELSHSHHLWSIDNDTTLTNPRWGGALTYWGGRRIGTTGWGRPDPWVHNVSQIAGHSYPTFKCYLNIITHHEVPKSGKINWTWVLAKYRKGKWSVTWPVETVSSPIAVSSSRSISPLDTR